MLFNMFFNAFNDVVITFVILREQCAYAKRSINNTMNDMSNLLW